MAAKWAELVIELSTAIVVNRSNSAYLSAITTAIKITIQRQYIRQRKIDEFGSHKESAQSRSQEFGGADLVVDVAERVAEAHYHSC